MSKKTRWRTLNALVAASWQRVRLQTANPRHIILRTSGSTAPTAEFVRTILRLAGSATSDGGLGSARLPERAADIAQVCLDIPCAVQRSRSRRPMVSTILPARGDALV